MLMEKRTHFETDGGAGIAHMAGVCPHCGVVSVFLNQASHYAPGTGRAWYGSVAQCNNCKSQIFLEATYLQGRRYQVEAIYPLPKLTSEFSSVPEEVAKDANESQLCFNVGAWIATAIMCRRTIQRSVRALGAKDADLTDQIDELATKGVLSLDIKNWAHEIRHFGNLGAHPDAAFGDVTQEDAAQMLDFLKAYLQYVYEMPERVQKARARRGKT